MSSKTDDVTGTKTTGHEWDGIEELDTPVSWVLKAFLYGTIAFSVLMWILYPAWPFLTDYTRGLLGYSSRDVVLQQVASGDAERRAAFADFNTDDFAALRADATLKERFEASIRVLYLDNCAACHGRELQGQKNFPDLTDDHWLWSGAPEEIELTLLYGINADHGDTRWAAMSAFGRDGLLEKDDINDVVDYVLSLGSRDHDGEAAARGAVVFEENCASCHEEQGVGGLENGAPSLADDAWIYGGDRASLLETLRYGREGVMPAWEGKLSAEEIRKLTMYVLWANDG